MKKPIPNYLDVFETRIKTIREKLKKELEKSKSERSRILIKRLIKEHKNLSKAVKEVKEAYEKRCPHCNNKI
jgi:hypothetical protein